MTALRKEKARGCNPAPMTEFALPSSFSRRPFMPRETIAMGLSNCNAVQISRTRLRSTDLDKAAGLIAALGRFLAPDAPLKTRIEILRKRLAGVIGYARLANIHGGRARRVDAHEIQALEALRAELKDLTAGFDALADGTRRD